MGGDDSDPYAWVVDGTLSLPGDLSPDCYIDLYIDGYFVGSGP